jgi:hypothetical protein
MFPCTLLELIESGRCEMGFVLVDSPVLNAFSKLLLTESKLGSFTARSCAAAAQVSSKGRSMMAGICQL